MAAWARAGEFAGGCRRLCVLDLQEAVSTQRLRLAARLVNAAPSLMALLQSDARRAWKDELSRDLDLLRQEMWPQLKEAEDFNAACTRNPRSHLQFPPPVCRLSVVTSAMLFTASSGPSDRTR